MPILNLSNPAFVSVTQAGRPNSGGTIEVYVADGLFTTLATVYSDQQKTVPLTNPVTLDDAGKAEIWYEVKVDVREKLSTGTIIDDYLNLDPNAADTVAQGFNLVDNGSFEVDTLSDGQPDSWTISPYAGSAVAITESVVTDGAKALEFNTTGVATGGGTATSIKFPVTEGSVVSVAFSFYATNATTLNTFQIKWYDEDDVLQSTSTVTMPASGSVPTSWTRYFEDITVDAAGTQGEVILTGISSGGSNLTSKAYFDGITITNANLVNLTGTQTLTNKTLTTPVIDGGTMRIATAQATTSGSTIDFLSIPSWVKKITVSYSGVSVTAVSQDHWILLGDAGGLEATGYNSAVYKLTSVPAIGSLNKTAEMITVNGTASAAATLHGNVILSLLDSATNNWCSSGVIQADTGELSVSSGSKALSDTLDRIQVGTDGTFDAGIVNILYEG